MKARLEFSRFRVVGKGRRNWDVYFLLTLRDAEDNAKALVTTVPYEGTINLDRGDRNYHNFGTARSTDGVTVLEMPVPQDGLISIDCRAMHSRDQLRDSGSLLSGIADALQQKGLVANIVETIGSPVSLVVSGAVLKAADIAGAIMENSRDKQLEHIFIEQDFSNVSPYKRKITGFNLTGEGVKLHWTWRIIRGGSS